MSTGTLPHCLYGRVMRNVNKNHSESFYSMANLTMFPNFLGFILLVCYRGDINRPKTVGKPSVAICFVNAPF